MGEANLQRWSVTIDKRDLVEAIGTARRRPTLRRVRGGPGGFESLVVIAAGPNGLSLRSSNSAMDIPATGMWSSPIGVSGAMLRQLAPKLSGSTVELSYCEGQLALNQTRIPAKEL